MSYQALYRRYRPATFDEILGQEHISRTLKNQIEKGMVSHAYLFTGTRGIGKTSAARILARAINCLSPRQGNPCLTCSACKENSFDIIEMDGASNNSVDQAREIKEKAQYLPANSKYKIYIIDEVHMLTGSAFNALLKTLEEPPAHVVFILCTTEAHKIPATILSRCMRFDFGLVPTQTIAGLIAKIFAEIGANATPEAINAIAAAGEGSVRDALSIADRLAAYGKKLDYDTVLTLIGATNKYLVLDFAEDSFNGNTGGVLSATEKLISQGKNISLFAKDLVQAFRDMLVILTAENPSQLLLLPEKLYEKLESAAATVSVKKLLFAMELFTDLEVKLQYSLSPRLLFEASALRLGMSSGEVDLDSIDLRLRALEKGGVTPLGGKTSSGAANPAGTKKQTDKIDIAENEPPDDSGEASVPPKAPKTAVEQNFAKARPVWADILEKVRETGNAMLSSLLAQVGEVWCEGKTLVVFCTQNQYSVLSGKQNHKTLQELAAKHGCALRLDMRDETEQDKKKQLEKIAGKIEVI